MNRVVGVQNPLGSARGSRRVQQKFDRVGIDLERLIKGGRFSQYGVETLELARCSPHHGDPRRALQSGHDSPQHRCIIEIPKHLRDEHHAECDSFNMKATSESRLMGTIGFATTPVMDAARSMTLASHQFGS